MSDNTYTSQKQVVSQKRDYSAQFAKAQENKERRARDFVLKVFQLKIQTNHLSKEQLRKLNRLFAETKWFYNAAIALSKQDENNKPWKYDSKKKTVVHLDKDRNPTESQFEVLSAAAKQEILKTIGANCKSIKTNKQQGNIKHSNGLRFKSEVNSIPLREYRSSWSVVSKNRVKVTGFTKHPFRVRGLDQVTRIEGVEFANAKLIKKPEGFFLHITCYVPKQYIESKRKRSYETIGVDFGCETSFTEYHLEADQCRKRQFVFDKPEKAKKIQRKIGRRKAKNFSKNTNKGKRLTNQLKRVLNHWCNVKEDAANKYVNELAQADLVIVQNEQLGNWQAGGHGKKITNGILGRVKAKLKAKKLGNVRMLDKMLATSKFCFDCFSKHRGLAMWDREFVCPNCGCVFDRDEHAAANMIEFYNLIIKVPTEYREPKDILDLLDFLEKRVERRPSNEELHQLVAIWSQGRSQVHSHKANKNGKRHEATEALASW